MSLIDLTCAYPQGADAKVRLTEIPLKSAKTAYTGMVYDLEFNSMDGYESMRNAYEQFEYIDGVVAATDTIASGAMKFLHEKGICIPEDVMIVGQGDSQLARIVIPELTTVRYFYEESGRKATEMLIEKLKGEENQPIRMVKLGYELIDRGSTELKK